MALRECGKIGIINVDVCLNFFNFQAEDSESQNGEFFSIKYVESLKYYEVSQAKYARNS